MKYAIRYFRDSDAITTADEIIIKQPSFFCPMDSLERFDKQYTPEQRIVIDLTKENVPFTDREKIEKQMETYAEFAKNRGNVAFKINYYSPNYSVILTELYRTETPFFFNTMCNTRTQVHHMAGMGVSDIYVCGELGFELKPVKEYCAKHNINVRVYPNFSDIEGACGFFIRPEDIKLYEEYVDICEFYTEDVESSEAGSIVRQDVLYEIYTKGRWNGFLHNIIYGLEEEIYNPTLVTSFGVARKVCRRDCLLNENMCHICPTVVEISRMWVEKNGQSI